MSGEDLRSTPIYYVVAERAQGALQMFGMMTILACISADLADIDALYTRYVAPMWGQGRNAQAFIFAREPDNILRNTAQAEPPGWLPGDEPGSGAGTGGRDG